jgi:hypothetical protein
MDNINEFLQELTKLSQKYNIYIGGCGCCGSPFLMDKTPETTASELIWDDNQYKCDFDLTIEDF